MIYQKLFLTIGKKLRWRKHADEKASEEDTELRTPQDVCVCVLSSLPDGCI